MEPHFTRGNGQWPCHLTFLVEPGAIDFKFCDEIARRDR